MQNLKKQAEDVLSEMHGMLDTAESEKRDLSDTEMARYKGLEAQADALQRVIETQADDKPYRVTFNKRGGENKMNLLDYVVRGQELPPELRSVAVGTSGGFFLSEPARAMGLSFQQEGLLGKCRRIKLEQNATTHQLASFMESDWSTNGPFGVAIAPTGETNDITESDLTAHFVKFDVQNFAGLITASRLFFDSAEGAGAIIAEAFNRNLTWKMDQQIISGSGVAQFTGILNSTCRIDISRTGATDIVFADVLNMMKSAMPYPHPGQNWIWIASPAAFARIVDLEDSGQTNLFVRSAANSPEKKLLGYPIYLSDSASALGTRGDLSLVDMNLFAVVEFGNPRLEVSKDVYFNADKVAVKICYFADGQSMMRSKITTASGDYSHIVVLN